jgi:hypothetical protein
LEQYDRFYSLWVFLDVTFIFSVIGMRLMKASFRATLYKYPGKCGWTFAFVPKKYAPSYSMGWGRTPVKAIIDGVFVSTSVWTDKTGKIWLPISKKVRGTKGDGDRVTISLEYCY